MLGGMYGLRIGEALGLRWNNVNMDDGHFAVVEQMVHRMPAGTKLPDRAGSAQIGIAGSAHYRRSKAIFRTAVGASAAPASAHRIERSAIIMTANW